MNTRLVKGQGAESFIGSHCRDRRELLLLPCDVLTKALTVAQFPFCSYTHNFEVLRLGSPFLSCLLFYPYLFNKFSWETFRQVITAVEFLTFFFLSYPYSSKLEMPGSRPAELVKIKIVSPESRSPNKFIGMRSIQGQMQEKSSASLG